MAFSFFFCLAVTRKGDEKMKDLTTMTIEQQNYYLAKRAYAAKWRAKNREKIKEYDKSFYLKQAGEVIKSKSDNPTI